MISFRQLKTGPVGRACGIDVESCQFLDYCRDAVRQLMTRGSWWSNVASIECCVRTSGILVWPRGVSTILALNVCGYPTDVQNRWYRFRPLDNDAYGLGQAYQRGGWSGGNGTGYNRAIGNIVTETNGTWPVFNQIEGTGFTIRTFISNLMDVGKKITFYGIDGNGQIVRTQRDDGTWQDGVQITLANPHVDTPMQFQKVSRVVKDETNGYLNCYQFNVAQGFLLDLAQYQPSETNPDYIVTRITRANIGGNVINYGGSGNNNCAPKQVSALVKLNFVPFTYDDDLVQIDNEDAIRDMVLSIRKKEQGDIAGAAAYESSAIHELNREAESRMPDEQIVVENRTFGSGMAHRRIY